MIHTKKRSKNRKKKQHRRNLKKTKRPLGTIAKRFLSITLGNFLFCNRYLLASHICAKQLTWKGFTCRWLLLAYLISNLVPFSPPSYQKIYLKYHPLHPKKTPKTMFYANFICFMVKFDLESGEHVWESGSNFMLFDGKVGDTRQLLLINCIFIWFNYRNVRVNVQKKSQNVEVNLSNSEAGKQAQGDFCVGVLKNEILTAKCVSCVLFF